MHLFQVDQGQEFIAGTTVGILTYLRCSKFLCPFSFPFPWIKNLTLLFTFKAAHKLQSRRLIRNVGWSGHCGYNHLSSDYRQHWEPNSQNLQPKPWSSHKPLTRILRVEFIHISEPSADKLYILMDSKVEKFNWWYLIGFTIFLQ